MNIVSRISHRASRAEVLVLGALFLIGLGLRLFRLASVPLGGHGDVAWNGLEALDWLHGAGWPFYIYHIYAPEPVIIYLTGLSIALFGSSFLAARLVTSLAGALVAPVGWLAVRWLVDPPEGGSEGGAGPRLRIDAAWLVALAYVVSFYPIILTKTGQRAQLFPLLVMGLLALFAYGWKSGKWWAFIASAGVVALANYTYIPARLMPLMVIGWAAHQFFVDRERFRARLVKLLVMGLLSALLVMPQLVMYIRTPEAFFARSSQTAGQFIFQTGLSSAALWSTLGRKLLGELAIWFLPWQGAYAEMGRSLLALPLGVGAVVAVIMAFFRPAERGLWWPLIGIPLMVLTDVLSGTQSEPHGLRMIGELPLVFVLAGQGLAILVEVGRRALPKWGAAAWQAALIALILVPGLADWWAYHWRYIPAQQADPATTNRLEAADVFLAELVLEHASDGKPILITLDDFTRPNVTYLLSRAFPVRRSALRADGLLDLPPDGAAWVVIPTDPYRPRHDGIVPVHDWRSWVLLVDGEMRLLPPMQMPLVPYEQGAEPLDVAQDWLGREVARLYLIDLRAAAFDLHFQPVDADLGGEVELAGYSVDSQTLTPGQPLWITLYWKALAGAAQDYETFVQIIDSGGQAVAQQHRWTLDGVYRTRLWRSDELTPTRFRLEVPDNLAPGPYTVIAGLYLVLENRPLPVLDEQGNPVALQVSLPGFRVALPPATIIQPPPGQPIRFEDTIRLAGLAVRVVDGSLLIQADWQALERPWGNHTLFIHVVDAADRIVAQLDMQPRAGAYPTGIWEAGEVVPDSYVIALPADLSAGEYAVYLGWYTLPSGERLTALVADKPVPDNRVPIFVFTWP